MLLVTLITGSFRIAFRSESYYAIHFFVGIGLVILAVVIILSHFKFDAWILPLQVLWWIPQALVVQLKYYNQTLKTVSAQSLYYQPFPFDLSCGLFWERSTNEYFSIQVNLVAILGIAFSVFLGVLRARALNKRMELT